MSLFTQPLAHTRRFKTLEQDDIYADELVVTAAAATENRGQLPLWSTFAKSNPERIIAISELDKDHISVTGNIGAVAKISLRDEVAIGQVLNSPRVLIDISGLPQHVWAPNRSTAQSDSYCGCTGLSN